MSTTTDIIRGGNIQTTIETLTELNARRRDLVIPMRDLHMGPSGNTLGVPEKDHELTDDGVTETVAMHTLTMSDLAHDHLADRLSIPRRYYRQMCDEQAWLRAVNVNTWMEADDRTVMLRTYTNPDGGPGLLRAVLSNRYGVIDNFDITMATLGGIRDAGINPDDITFTGDITENGRLRMRIWCENLATHVGDIMRDYRSPWNGKSAQELPLMFAGVDVSNSETGGGAFTVVPRVVLQACSNGMTQTTDVERRVHLGGRLEDGVIEWSNETNVKELELITSKARDAIATFMSVEYVEKVADRLREVADVEVTPQTAVEVTTKALALSEGEQTELLALFGASGQRTALGVGHAVTALAQQADSDRSAEMEAAFMDVVTASAAAVA